ncbi:LuxR family transcriptional regulator [Verrucosispora sp. WMMD573]|uniref:helix-turn-helix transcriptional regulator n=1 Tax=Verrucosispora sp. WMMD573 TaxID=3015149 RepID=UPI00248AC7C6|nr:LuxR family transcriptional regulator [Verrucosispora sp. WMMD573]WBB52936.1 LuxR C-terminal-related transcriptional regulator [Verrucosispora sp. WMMD573]
MINASTVQIAVLRGRQAECREIRSLLAAPAGKALLLHGEPGSGRSTLLAYAHRHGRGRRLLAATGLPDEAMLPYAGLQRLLDPVLDGDGALPERQRQVLRRAVAGEGCRDQDQLVLSHAVLGLLAEAAHDGPLLCTMDDVDVGDAPTARLLTLVARRLPQLPVVLLLTAGSDSGADAIPGRRLLPLDEPDSHALLAARRPGPPPPGPVLAGLNALAAGNPQALVDLADSLTQGQWHGAEPLPTTPPADGGLVRAYRGVLFRLPGDTRRALLLAALAATAPAASEQADVADPVTLGRALRAVGDSLAALAPAEAAGLIRLTAPGGAAFPRSLTRAMVEATASVTARREAHLLLAAALDGTGARLRRALHLAAATDGPAPALATELADAVDDRVDPLTAATALARAADLSDDPVLAASRQVTAARYAWQAGDPGRARALLHRVADAPGPTAALPDGGSPTSVRRDIVAGAPPDGDPPAPAGRVAGSAAVCDRGLATAIGGLAELLRGEIRLRCGSAPAALPSLLSAASALAEVDRESALVALVRAGEAVCFCGDQYRYAEVARRMATLRRDGDPPWADLLTTLVVGVAATLRGDHAHAGPLLRRAVVLGGRLTDAAVTPTALTGAAVAGLLVAVDAAAYRLADRAVELAADRGEMSLLPRALELRAMSEYWLGRHEAATQSCREGLRVARAAGQHTSAGVHLGLLAVLAAVRSDHEASLGHVAELGDVAVPGSRPHALAEWALAMLDLVDARYADAADRLAALARPGTGRGQVLVQVMATPYLVEAAAHDGRQARARAALTVFDRWAGSTASPLRRALSARCHALLATRGSAEAERHFRAALSLHPCDAATFERARTELLFGRELRHARRPREARGHLHRARQTFVLLGAQAWARQSTVELRAAGESVGTPDPCAVRLLTGQQLRVAHLVASGATNQEVARQMFLSTRTVDHHLRNIYHRLGIRSRTELVRALG